jgi:phosphomannomutase
MTLVLALLARTRKTVSALRAEIPAYAMLKDKLAIRNEAALGVLRALRARYRHATLNLEDGVHADFGERWVLARMSNTEPVLRITVEAPDDAGAQALLGEVRTEIKSGA